MTVSVVIPTYNRARLLSERAIPSVRAQTHADWELHVVGDGTDAESAKAARALVRRDPRIRFTNLPHQEYPTTEWERWALSAVDAINHGWDTATGDWLLVLGDDDELEPDALERLLAIAALHPDADVVYGVSRGYQDGRPIPQTWGAWPPGRGSLTEGASIRRTALPFRYDKGCIGRGLEGDADLWARMIAAGVRFHFEPGLEIHRYWRR